MAQNANPYKIIKRQHVTEKAMMLQQLHTSQSNKCIKAFENPKYVFIVDKAANKREIANAVEEIYSDRKVKVISVNTVNVREKARRVRGRAGFKAAYKKAIVTLEKGDSLDNV
jgi:large subunit ribosomal protein L23